jgi:adenosine deaminase
VKLSKRLLGVLTMSALLIRVVSGATAELPEERAARYLASIHQNPSLLIPFLRAMPKGGDLHIHLAGAIYAEKWIDYAAQDNFCVDRRSSGLVAPPCDTSCGRDADKPAVGCAYQDPILYNQLVDAWSMRNFNHSGSGHDHFFASFEKFLPASVHSPGPQLAEVAARAAAEHEQYLELMHTAGGDQAAADLAAKLRWDDDLAKMRATLLAGGLKIALSATRAQLSRDEASQRTLLRCDSPQPDAGCQVTVRYLYQVLRGLPRATVFAQMLLGFELAQADPRFVGLNLVMPEDWYVPMHDFDVHMKMIDYLHTLYPKVHISLHAGELSMGLVPPDGLRSHIRKSIELGHAERIGHGVSVMNEDDALGLLKEMAQKKVLVEICLTSNDMILGVAGANHPLPVYIQHGVPVTLATDDEGVSRTDMTHEYLRAVATYDLPYSELKRMARLSLEHSFLSGPSLWADTDEFHDVAACATERAGAQDNPSAPCGRFLAESDRAKAQWQLEREFAKFERQY